MREKPDTVRFAQVRLQAACAGYLSIIDSQFSLNSTVFAQAAFASGKLHHFWNSFIFQSLSIFKLISSNDAYAMKITFGAIYLHSTIFLSKLRQRDF